MTYAEHGFQQSLSAAKMARETAWAYRRIGNESEARRSFQRAYWWLTRARMWRRW